MAKVKGGGGGGSSSGPVVKVDGADDLAKSIDRAARELDDFREVNAEAAAKAAAEVRARAPRRSGALAASVRVGQVTDAVGLVEVGQGLAYAGVIQYGWPSRGIMAQPFVTEGAHRSESGWIDLYADHLARTIGKIHS